MTALFVDCPTGLAGDMLLAAFLDLGVPRAVIEAPLAGLGLEKGYALTVAEDRSAGLRGLRLSVEGLDLEPPHRLWHDIRALIMEADWSEPLRTKVLTVFKALAEAEAAVHGHPIEQVHFHEVGMIDALVEVVGVCAAVEHLAPEQIVCAVPPAGRGKTATAHGFLPVPVPAVLELARRHQICLEVGDDLPACELTTPTGLALMAVLAERFCQPPSLRINAIGVGLGHRNLDRPNILRICELDGFASERSEEEMAGLRWQPVVVQEAWIDDATPEDVAVFSDQLRDAGALDVVSEQVQMKKGRQGVSVKALVTAEQAPGLRVVWFSQGTTLGLREHSHGRWLLPRRGGSCPTPWGSVRVKQVRRPQGILTVKPEHDDLLRLSVETGHSMEELRREVLLASEDFVADEDWTW
ncbi:LarC family nickel insertion protein [Prochlorococcus sp. MIT 1201]|uniref:LarC family nickel insertion protein n=1 Tax=Prochlorococcus sp. MIT 1201 TaxID=3082535 RepID=UPI0039A69A76